MSLFLRHFKRSLQLKLIFGACPFVVDPQNTHVFCTQGSTIYTAILTLGVTAVYSYLLYKALICFETEENTTTRNLNITIKHNFNFAVFVVLLTLSLRNRHQHVQIVNLLAIIFDRIHKALPQTNQSKQYRRLHAANVVYVLAFFSCPVSKLFFLEANETECVLDMIPFFILFGYVLSNMLTAIVHIQDVVIVICNSIDGYCGLSPPGPTDETVRLLDDLYDLTRRLNKCFGCHLLLTSLNGITFMAGMLLVNIRRIVFDDHCYTWFEVYFFSIFILPHVVKTLIQALVFDRLERKLSELEQFLLNSVPEPHEPNIQMDIMHYKILHNDNYKSITACGFFTMNVSLLFKVHTTWYTRINFELQPILSDDRYNRYILDDNAAV